MIRIDGRPDFVLEISIDDDSIDTGRDRKELAIALKLVEILPGLLLGGTGGDEAGLAQIGALYLSRVELGDADGLLINRIYELLSLDTGFEIGIAVVGGVAGLIDQFLKAQDTDGRAFMTISAVSLVRSSDLYIFFSSFSSSSAFST